MPFASCRIDFLLFIMLFLELRLPFVFDSFSISMEWDQGQDFKMFDFFFAIYAALRL
jgi:hypothetical protein